VQTHLEDFRLAAMAIENRAKEEASSALTANIYLASAFKARAEELARMADAEAANFRLAVRNPVRLVAAFCGQAGGPSAEDIGKVLRAFCEYLAERPELADVRLHVERAAEDAESAAEADRIRAEEDLDAAAAAASDEAYDRKVDAGLIGRCPLNPEVA